MSILILLINDNLIACYIKDALMKFQLIFSDFSPMNNAEVAPRSDFSFFASESISPKTIKVTIKGQSVPVTVVQKQNGYKVSGKLPNAVKGTYAKINIDAKGIAQCEISTGWLVKVTQ